MNYQKRICLLLSKIVKKVPYKIRENGIHQVPTYVGKIEGTYEQHLAQTLIIILDIKTMVFSSCGECGLVIFFDSEFKEVIRMAFEENSKGISAWIVK
jgi:hypothetical protein